MHSIVCGTGTPKDRVSYILFEYIDPTEVGTDIRLPEVEFRKPRNLFVCVSEEREDLTWENRPANRSVRRETGLEMPCFPASDLLWVQITQSYPNRLRFWIPGHQDGGWRRVPHTLCRLFQTRRRTGV